MSYATGSSRAVCNSTTGVITVFSDTACTRPVNVQSAPMGCRVNSDGFNFFTCNAGTSGAAATTVSALAGFAALAAAVIAAARKQ